MHLRIEWNGFIWNGKNRKELHVKVLLAIEGTELEYQLVQK